MYHFFLMLSFGDIYSGRYCIMEGMLVIKSSTGTVISSLGSLINVNINTH